jgi:stage V sporulation protein AE
MMYLKAFLVGGLICAIGQVLVLWTKMTSARILVLFVVVGALLTGLGLYQPLVEWAGSGATVPLTGFGYSLAKGAMDGVAEKGISGILTGGIANTAGGVAAAMLFGWLNAIIFTPKTKT